MYRNDPNQLKKYRTRQIKEAEQSARFGRKLTGKSQYVHKSTPENFTYVLFCFFPCFTWQHIFIRQAIFPANHELKTTRISYSIQNKLPTHTEKKKKNNINSHNAFIQQVHRQPWYPLPHLPQFKLFKWKFIKACWNMSLIEST